MEGKYIEIVNKDGVEAIKNKKTAVAVILYTLDESELLDKIGVVTEKNPHFPDGTYTGLVMGGIEIDDKSLLSRAKAEAKEEAGYEIENERWNFLGEIYASKLIPDPVYCYSADITGLEGSKPKGDGSEIEKGISFQLIPLSSVQSIPDSLLQTCFFKLFSKLYKNHIYNGRNA